MKVLKEGLNVFQLIAGQTEKMFQDFWDFMETFQFTFERLWRKNPRHPVTSAIVCWRILTSSSKTKYNSYWHSVTCVIHVDKDVYDLVSSWFLGSPPSLDNYIQYVVQHYLFTSCATAWPLWLLPGTLQKCQDGDHRGWYLQCQRFTLICVEAGAQLNSLCVTGVSFCLG